MALPDSIGALGGTTRTSGIAAAAIASGANYLGSAIDNATNLDDIADIEIVWAYATAPTASKTLSLHLLYAMDGTNYEEGAGDGTGTGDVDPLACTEITAISPAADTSTHRKFISVDIAPYACKLLVRNVDTAQEAAVTVNIKTRKSAQITD